MTVARPNRATVCPPKARLTEDGSPYLWDSALRSGGEIVLAVGRTPMNRRHFLASSALATSLAVVRTRAAVADDDTERRYTAEGETIEFGPGRVEHTYTQIRGALPKWDGPSVYVTEFTPFEITLRIG